jgi:DNA adenine methylase
MTPQSADLDWSPSLPFLRWPGGKRWLRNYYSEFLPVRAKRYIEPFVGSGAIFFGVDCGSAILADVNGDLIDTYRAIKEDWRSVTKKLTHHAKRHSAEYYYAQRAARPRALSARAARFIYLNRTCFNGIYRVNLKGEFNVPIGTRASVLLDTDNFERTSKLLQCADLRVSDFQPVLESARKGDFVFVDPPYTVAHNTNGFLKYNEQIFSWNDQLRLRKTLLRLSQRGIEFILTNADHPSIVELYSDDFCVRRVSRNSAVGSLATYRNRVTELLICARK